MLDNVAGILTFATVSPDTFTSVTCTTVKYEENRVPVVDMPVLMFSGKLQLSCI